MQILITPRSKLSHLYVHNPPLSFYGREMSSIEKIRWYATLRQCGQDDVADRLRFNRHLERHPAEIKEWVPASGVKIRPEWLFRARHVYMDIMLRQLQHQSSGFHDAFKEVVDNEDHPLELNFLVSASGSDYVWSTGLRQTQLPAATFPGSNIFGECLQDLVIRYMGDNLNPIIGTPQAYVHNNLSVNPAYSKSVLLLADSQARNVKYIAGGRAVSISGGRFQDLVEATEQLRIHPRNFNTVIVSCGVNDAQRDVQMQRNSWAIMQQFLQELVEQAPAPRVIVSLPVPHPDVPGITSMSNRIENQLADVAGIRCLNWGSIECPFVNDDGQPNLALFDSDRFHINHAGFRALVNGWASMVDMVKYIDFLLTSRRRARKRDHSGQFV